MKKIITSAVLLASMLAVHARQGSEDFFKSRYKLEAKPLYNVCGPKGSSVTSNKHIIYARVTVYWKEDYYTRRGLTSSGMPLVSGESAAVDPSIIPYGSTIEIPGYGDVKAVDTGSAVVSRKASRAAGSRAPVIDLYFDKRRAAMEWEASHPPFMTVSL